MTPLSAEGTLNAELCGLAMVAFKTSPGRFQILACLVYTATIPGSVFFYDLKPVTALERVKGMG